jgi:dihydroorotate dehydrogenase electron transfer subunit
MLYLGKALAAKGHDVQVMLGMQNADTAGIIEDFTAAGLAVQIATNDGSLGACGHVTCLVEDKDPDWTPECRVYACGPKPMLLAVQSWTAECGLETELSLEERMGCGLGACLACVCKVKVATESGWEYQRVCMEGPVFSAREVILDD